MLLLTCPNCGPRNVSEFRFGGEKNTRSQNTATLTNDQLTNYLYMRENKRGPQVEWWYHRAGCGLWFLAERNTDSNQVLRTYQTGETRGSQ